MSHSDTSVETVKASEGNPEAGTQDDLPRRSDIISQPTEKMVQYKSEELEKREKELFSTFDKWRQMIREVRNVLKSVCEGDKLHEILDRGHKNAAYAGSIFSKSDAGSTQSKLSEILVEASAEFAAKQIELNMLKEEQIQKERLSRLEYEQKLAVEAHQNELKRLETRRELEVAHVRLNAYSQVNTSVQNHNKTLITDIDNTFKQYETGPGTTHESKPASPAVVGMNPFNVVSSFDKPKQKMLHQAMPRCPLSTPQPLDNTTKNSNDTNTLEIVNLKRLPVPEPAVFTGDSLQYMEWKTSFEMLIDRKGIPTTEKIFYLKKYVGGAARKALEGYFYNTNQTAYDNARKVLRKGHLNKDCKRKHTCNTCKGKHPPCLHEERPPVRQQTSNVSDSNDVNNVELKTSKLFKAVTELPHLVMKDLVNALEGDFAHDKGQLKKVSQEEITFLYIMDDYIRKRNDGHLEMPLSFKERPQMENNKKLEELRLNHLKRKLMNDQKYHEQNKVFMNEMLTRGDAELVTTEG
ncbi:unnamed protein product [Mytilus edulis]|uniref:Uncharacterized protein n=1 Tax=Mytilus edulis TaxID=6550 RepID=A0A8S3SIM0_MYTED|nr:unnamed protein product [Mytilus edulis]